MKGFTIIEVVVVVAIIATISTLGVISYSQIFMQNEVINSFDVITDALRRARYYSLISRNNSDWGVHKASDNKLTIFSGNSYPTRNIAFDENYDVNSNMIVNGLTDIVFTRLIGTPSTTAPVTISSSGYTKQITINDLGAISE